MRWYNTTWPEEHPVRTDHIPVVSHFDVGMETFEEPPRPNFRATNWKEFKKVLAMKLEGLHIREGITSERKFFSHMDKLTHSIADT